VFDVVAGVVDDVAPEDDDDDDEVVIDQIRFSCTFTKCS